MMLRAFTLALGIVAALQPAMVFGADIDNGGANGGGKDYGPSVIPASSGPISRIKDIAVLQSSRDNQLVGYGLVIGLQGTGDGLRNSPYTEQSIRAMLENLGIALEGGRARAKNVAAVIVTANLPAFAGSGARIDVSVSSLGDATSLNGGTLIMTPLKAANGEIYAVAQGSVFVSGFSAAGAGGNADAGRPDIRAHSERRNRRAAGGRRIRRPERHDAAVAQSRLLDRGHDHRRHQRIFAGPFRQARRRRAGFAHRDPAQAERDFGGALHCRAGEPDRRIRHPCPRRRRRTLRHDRHRPGRAHLQGGDQPRHAHRAHLRNAENRPARAVLERARPPSSRSRRSRRASPMPASR